MQTYLKSRPVWIQLLLFMGMAFGIVLITSLISTGILAPLLGINALDVLSSSKWGNYPNMLLYLRILLLLNFILLRRSIEILKSQFITTKLSHFEQRQCYLIDPPFKNAAWHYKRDSQPPISDPVFSSP